MLDLEDAVRFVVARGSLMGSLPAGGKMAALGTGVEQVRRWIQGREADVSIASINAPDAVVISGRAEAVDAIMDLAREAGLRVTPLEVSHAFHSPLMDPILGDLSRVAASMRVMQAGLPVISNVTGDFHVGSVDPEYWSNHVRQPVLFHAGMEKIINAGASLLVEIGPHPALTPAVATSFDTSRVQPVPTLRRDGKDFTNLLGALAQLYANGAALNLNRLFWSPRYQRVSLPLYPFRRDRHWVARNESLHRGLDSHAETLPDLPGLHPLLGVAVARTSRRTVFQVDLSVTSPWTDHRVLGNTVFPGTAYLDMAVRAYAATCGQTWQEALIKDVVFERPLILAYRKPKSVSIVLEQESHGSGEAQFSIAAAENKVDVYARGRIVPSDAKAGESAFTRPAPKRPADVQIGPFYGELRKIGLEYGAKFANVRELWLGQAGSGEAFGRICSYAFGDNPEPDPLRNAVLLDGCLHVFGAAMNRLSQNGHEGAYVPSSIESVTFWKELPAQVWSQARVNMLANGLAALADIRVLDDAGEVLAEFKGLELRHVASLSEGKASSANTPGTGLINKSRAELIEFLRASPRDEQVRELARWLTAEIRDTMGQAADGIDIDSLPASTAFVEIGLDSLLVTELQRRIQQKLEFRFKPMQGLDYQRIDSMAEYLLDTVLAASLQREPMAVAAGVSAEISEGA
jgi:acyl transferase domain-containing protein